MNNETQKSVFFNGGVMKGFFKGIKKETKMVKWPSMKELMKYSGIVISMMIFFCLFFYGLDLIFTFVKGLVG